MGNFLVATFTAGLLALVCCGQAIKQGEKADDFIDKEAVVPSAGGGNQPHAAEAKDLLWEENYAAALAKAKAEKRPLFLMLTAHACVWCRKLEQETLVHPRVRAALDRIRISNDDKGLRIRVLNCTTPPRWGEPTTLHLVGADIRATIKDYAFASWDHGFEIERLIAHGEKDELIVEDYSLFKDYSGRTNYRVREVFKRSPEDLNSPAEHAHVISPK